MGQTLYIIEHINKNAEINRETKGKHEIIAYVDDIKCHAPTRKGIKMIAEEIEKTAAEIGLQLNRDKCGIYTRAMQDEEENTPFLEIVQK